MTVRLAGAETAISDGPPTVDFPPVQPDLGRYRAAVGELAAEIGRYDRADGATAERIVARRLRDEPFADVLAATPGGLEDAAGRLLFEVRNHLPGPPGRSAGLASMTRISLLAQIDAAWWGSVPAYRTDSDVLTCPDLVDLDDLGGAGQIRFTYRRQAMTLWHRAARSAQRRALPGRAPRTAGMWLAMTRPPVLAWLNELAEDFARLAPAGTPPLWVTSLTRSAAHQRHLRALGYVALIPSAHCTGHAADIEVAWYRRFRAHRILRGLLLDRQRAGEANVIDEGQAWHVCLHPRLMTGRRRMRGPAGG